MTLLDRLDMLGRLYAMLDAGEDVAETINMELELLHEHVNERIESRIETGDHLVTGYLEGDTYWGTGGYIDSYTDDEEG